MSTFQIVLCIVVSHILGFVIGYKYRAYLLQKELQKIADDAIKYLQRHIENQKVVHLSVHREGDTFLVYNEITEEFLAQGKSIDEVANVLQSRFPDTHFTIDHNVARSIGFK